MNSLNLAFQVAQHKDHCVPVDTTTGSTPYREHHRISITASPSSSTNNCTFFSSQLSPVSSINTTRYRTQDVFKSYRHPQCRVLKHIGIETTLSPLTTKSPRYTYSILLLPRPTWHNFHKDQHNLLKCNSTYGQVQKYIRSLDILHLRGTINWSFNICFIFFYFVWWGELFCQSYHMLRFINTVTSHCSYIYVICSWYF